MTEETLKVICIILHDKFHFDDLDVIEFIMEYEKRTGTTIPDAWLTFSTGKMKTVKINNI